MADGKEILSAERSGHGIDFALLTRERAELGESPVWCAQHDCLWWVDVAGCRLLRTRGSDGYTEAWPTPELPGFVVLTQTGAPAVGMESGIFAFAVQTGKFERIVQHDIAGARFNDATVDAAGRLWAATMDNEIRSPIGALYSVGDDMKLAHAADGLITSNGLAADEKRGRLYLSDSHPTVQTIWAIPCDFATGELGEREMFVSMSAMTGRPDGAAIDQDGNYWIAGVGGGMLHVFSPDGIHLQEYETPFEAPTKLAFGGDNHETVFLTSKGGGAPNGAVAVGRARGGAAFRGRPQMAWQVAT